MAFDTQTHKVLATALGVQDLSPEKQEEIIGKCSVLIYQAVIIRAVEEMNEETIAEFNTLLDSNPQPDVLFTFFRKNIPDFDSMIEEEAKMFIEGGQEVMKGIGDE